MDKKLKIKKCDKLRAYWSKKENDLIVYHPFGHRTGADLCYLFTEVFTKKFQDEMTHRGYDLSTLKFEISPKLPNTEKFPTLTKEYFPDNTEEKV